MKKCPSLTKTIMIVVLCLGFLGCGSSKSSSSSSEDSSKSDFKNKKLTDYLPNGFTSVKDKFNLSLEINNKVQYRIKSIRMAIFYQGNTGDAKVNFRESEYRSNRSKIYSIDFKENIDGVMFNGAIVPNKINVSNDNNSAYAEVVGVAQAEMEIHNDKTASSKYFSSHNLDEPIDFFRFSDSKEVRETNIYDLAIFENKKTSELAMGYKFAGDKEDEGSVVLVVYEASDSKEYRF